MISRFVLVFATLIGVVLNICSARAVTYTATLLHPVDFLDSAAVSVFGNSQFGTASGVSTHSHPYAALWNGSAASHTNVNPPGFLETYGLGISASNMVGYGVRENENRFHALLWNSDGTSFTDLNPPGVEFSYALHTSGASQVGQADGRALLWSGSAASAIDLTPRGYTTYFGTDGVYGAAATDAFGNSQVGYAGAPVVQRPHALLWHGTPESFVDLHPQSFKRSYAYGLWDTFQVGRASHRIDELDSHAILWHGTAASAIDLNPNGYIRSQAKAISAAGQVGSGWISSPESDNAAHALYWNGTAESAVDLNPYVSHLLPDFVSAFAEDITDDGTIVGYARYDTYGIVFNYAVMWTPVPEPTSVALIACGFSIASLLTRRLGSRRRVSPKLAPNRHPASTDSITHTPCNRTYLSDRIFIFFIPLFPGAVS